MPPFSTRGISPTRRASLEAAASKEIKLTLVTLGLMCTRATGHTTFRGLRWGSKIGESAVEIEANIRSVIG